MTKNKEYKEFIQCDCGSEYIIFEPQDIEFLEDGLYISIFTQAYNKPSFWHRFRHIWYTLKTGKPYTDQVCLDLDKIKKLNKYLDNYIALAELNTKCHNKNASNKIFIVNKKVLSKKKKEIKNEKKRTK